jgi:4-amino-4-deoxy-L-arabinose transferase-like glycosyltransferase
VWRILCFLIVTGSALRLYAFDGPLLDHHFLRQVDTAAIARNFAEEGMNILYPRVDWRGASSGYVESEFQIYTFVVAALYRVLGEHVEIARAVNIVCFALTALVLLDFGRRMFDVPTALLAVFFLSFSPLHAYFSRTFQPDALMVLCMLAALNFFWRWCDDRRLTDLAVGAVALCVAVLIKPLNLLLGAPLLYLASRYFGWKLFTKPQLWAFGALALIPSVLWYSHAYQLWGDHGNTLFRAYSDTTSTSLWSREFPFPIVSLNYPSYASALAWRFVYLIAAIGGLLPLLVGATLVIRERNWLLITWVAAFAATMVVFAYQHRAHDYYQLPMVPVACLMMGVGTRWLWQGAGSARVTAFVAAGMCSVIGTYWFWLKGLQGIEYANSFAWVGFSVAGLALLFGFALAPQSGRALVAASLALFVGYGAWQMSWLTVPHASSQARYEFGERLRQLTEPNSRIVIAQNVHRPGWFQHRTAQGELIGYMPMDFYLSHRKGWSISSEHANPEFLEALRQRGAAYFAAFCCQAKEGSVEKEYPQLYDYLACAYSPLEVTKSSVIYRLDPPRRRSDGTSCVESKDASR